MRAIVHLLSCELFGDSLDIADFPDRALVGVDFSGSPAYARRLARRLEYTNTFFDRRPRLDILELPAEYRNACDFVICSEILEHVAPPVQRAFDNLYAMLKPGGLLVLTVPYQPAAETVEHFPELYEYELVPRGPNPILRSRMFLRAASRALTAIRIGPSWILRRPRWILRNRTRAGAKQHFEKLTFHGRAGWTLEMRVFSERGLIANLEHAGFGEIALRGEDVPERGILWRHPWSLPVTARVPAAAQRRAAEGS